MRRDQYPAAPEWVVSPVRYFIENIVGHLLAGGSSQIDVGPSWDKWLQMSRMMKEGKNRLGELDQLLDLASCKCRPKKTR